jgi:homogentisate 1,2-dioxygenase
LSTAGAAKSKPISDRSILSRAITSTSRAPLLNRIVPETRDNFFLIIQSKHEFEQPEKGLLGQHALYDPAVIITPEPAPNLDDNTEWEVRIQAEDEISKVVYPFNPLDVVGWKGDLTVWKINMRDIRPVMSHRAHLPPRSLSD